METYFASPKRLHGPDLNNQVRLATQNPVVDEMMRATSGLLAVLNQHRQIVSLNQTMLDLLGVEDPEELFGLRPGEAVGCRFADNMPAGCGTGEYCLTCGAAIAIVACLEDGRQVERNCALSIERNGHIVDLYFRVQASSLWFQNECFILLYLQDITDEQNRAALERAFFHDMNNIIMGLLNAAELLPSAPPGEDREIAGYVTSLSRRLAREVALQRHLLASGNMGDALLFEYLPVDLILQTAWSEASCHPAAEGKTCQIQNSAPQCFIETELASLLRVLGNMLINALEAAQTSRIIRLDACETGENVTFNVWNRECMDPSVAKRIFQRNFSTKNTLGRGLGTYSMKLIGEQVLGGRVAFRSSPSDGTTFYICLPIHRQVP